LLSVTSDSALLQV